MQLITRYWQTINIISILLYPLSLFYCSVVSIRRVLYHSGLFNSYQAAIPVIVVGNIYIGGNGKTPFVIWLVNQLKAAGYKPAIVSRGYGAVKDNSNEFPFPRQVNLQQNRQLFSDEPILIYQSTQCPVFIDPVRTRAVQRVESITDCDVIISDDGLQHYAMSRFIEINITDARRLYGNGLCLPAGPLRERPQRLKSVDYHIFNKSRVKVLKSEEQYAENEFSMAYEVNSLESLFDDENRSMSLNELKGKTVHAVAGIGEPDNFFTLLKDFGLTIIEHPFADHYQYQRDDLIFAQPHPIIMTQKDAVKCQSLALQDKLREYWFLPIEAKIEHRLIKSIIKQLKTFELDKRK